MIAGLDGEDVEMKSGSAQSGMKSGPTSSQEQKSGGGSGKKVYFPPRNPKPGFKWERVEVTPDSGAAETVGPKSKAKHCKVQPTGASKGGVTYRNASSGIMHNVGQKTVFGFNSQGSPMDITWQVTEPGVSRVLCAVRKMCAAGNRVVFDEDGSCILNKKTGLYTNIEERNGTYAFDLWTEVPDKSMDVDGVEETGTGKVEEKGGTVDSGFLGHL